MGLVPILVIDGPPFTAQVVEFRLLRSKMLNSDLLCALPTFFQDAYGDGIDDESTVAGPFAALDPADGVGVRGRVQLASGDSAKIIGDDIVIAHAVAVTMNAVQKLDQFDRLNVEAGFLADLANDACDERLTDLEQAAGECPVALEGLGAAANQEHVAILHDNRAHANEWRLRKLAFNDAVHICGRVDFEATSQFCHGR
jgi:hypothetical protein